MKIFIWERVEDLTENYHSGGGCAIVAENLEGARKKLPSGCGAQKIEPDFVCEVSYPEEKVFIFPDAGCC